MKAYLGLSLVSLLPRAASAPDTASARAETALHVLQDWYNPGSGIWDTCGWWNGANCMTVLGNLALVDGSEYVHETALEVFNNTFHVGPGSNPYAFKPPPAATQTSSPTASSGAAASPTSGYWGHNPQWVDGSFDDDGWWALAWITAYDNTQQQEYLNAAIDIYESLASTEKTRCGNAGIYTDLNAGYANAVTNELFLSVGAHLANRVPDKKRYLQQAQRQWDWFQNVGFINENGTINDGLTDFCTNNGQPVWSYNQGIVLGALVELHRASTTPCLCARGKNSTNSTNSTNTSYLESATRIAKAAIKELADPDSLVIRESCDPDDCDGNSTQFKGIFIRNLRVLHGAAPDREFVEVIRANADSVWENDRSEDQNQLGESWEGPVKQVDASTHSSAMGALVAAIGV